MLQQCTDITLSDVGWQFAQIQCVRDKAVAGIKRQLVWAAMAAAARVATAVAMAN